ncbi:MAG: MBG domain-containing protein [Saccharofermentans sp.]|nr:MBG domain-containing protein [Saccharofermentans sp.]
MFKLKSFTKALVGTVISASLLAGGLLPGTVLAAEKEYAFGTNSNTSETLASGDILHVTGFPGNSRDVVLTITAPAGCTINIKGTLDIENGYDKLYLYDGDNSGGDYFYYCSSRNTSVDKTTTTNVLKIRYQTDISVLSSMDVAVSVAHSHNFAYAAQGSVVTATCTSEINPCTYHDNGIALTLNAPADLTYDGNAKSATISGYPDEDIYNLAAQPASIAYYRSTGEGSVTPDGDALDGAPTDAGNYVAQMTWGGATASKAFTIAKAPINPSVSIDDWVYGAAAKTPSVTGNTDNGTVTYTYAAQGSTDFSATVPTAAGDYTVKATVAETANYAGASATADFTISKADITPRVTISGWTYGGTASTPEVTGNTGNGTVTYTYASQGSTDFSATVPTAAGDYTVKAAVAASSNCNAGEATANFTIAKADLTAAPVAVNPEFRINAQDLVSINAPEGYTMYYALGTDATTAPAASAYSKTIPTATAVGTYYVWYKAVGDANHNDAEPACVEAKIIPTTYSFVSGNDGSWLRGDDKNLDMKLTNDLDTAFENLVAIKVDNAVVPVSNYEVTKGSLIVSFKVDYLKTLSVGEHTVTFVFADGEISTKLTVKEATATVTQTGEQLSVYLIAGIACLALAGSIICFKKWKLDEK